MFNRNTFATRLKTLREERGMNQNELANGLGVSRGSISFYENGSRLPDIDVIYRICGFFRVTSDYLIGLTDNREVQNMEIGNKLGLSDEAINMLVKLKDHYVADVHVWQGSKILNMMFTHPRFPSMVGKIGIARNAFLGLTAHANIDIEKETDEIEKKVKPEDWNTMVDYAYFRPQKEFAHISEDIIDTLIDESIKQREGALNGDDPETREQL